MTPASALRSGVLEMAPGGHGYLRDPARGYRVAADDVRVERATLERFGLRPGVRVSGEVGPAGDGRGVRLIEPSAIEGREPDGYSDAPAFADLTAVDPHERLRLETGAEPLTTRVIDLFTPVGKGQRGLIVAPPRSGKTVILQHLAQAILANHAEATLILLLVDERPEELTEMRRSVAAEVVGSSNDRPPEEHIRLAELTIERAKRLAEAGGHVVLLLDSLTRLARAYNKGSNSGRTMSGGVDIRALDAPKSLFGAARAFQEGGSLTILATCLVETNSRMDELIFHEFQGTGNMELFLDRHLAERRLWPAIDLLRSGTRREELLLDPTTLGRLRLLRRTLAGMKPAEAIERLVGQLAKSPTNAAFLDRIGGASPS